MKKLVMVLLFLVSYSLPSHTLAGAKENLQAIIDQAKEGSTVRLDGGIYDGNIVITKTLTLIGTKGTVIKGDGTGNVISVRAPNVTLKNFSVTHGSMNRNSAEEYAGIKVYSNGNRLEDINVSDSFHGVYLSQAHGNLLRNIHIKGHGKNKIASQGNGIHVYYANKNKFIDNEIDGTRDGFFFDYANENEIDENTVRNTRYGLHYMYSEDNHFKNNLFTMNTGGAAIMNSNRILLTNNRFIFNYGHRSFGVLLLSANEITVKSNLFFLNQRGLYIDQSTNNNITENQLIKNQIGIELWASSNDQTFTKNVINANTIPAVTLGGQGRNSWDAKGIGNDWGSSFPLIDLDQNGVGDDPVVFQSSLYKLIEDQELTYLFLKSPAIKGYEKLSQLLNRDKVMFEDHYPLISTESTVPWGFLFAGFILLFILLRGRTLLCTISGRNGRKT